MWKILVVLMSSVALIAELWVGIVYGVIWPVVAVLIVIGITYVRLSMTYKQWETAPLLQYFGLLFITIALALALVFKT